ncbi:MAG: hypothetical protein PSV16_02065 [Flavobacterium sp.]|nr:hypothetical protein [Flavobacterium sp.]
MNPYVVTVTSSDRGFTLAFSWEQTSSSYSVSNNVVTVDVFGKVKYNCFFNGLGTMTTITKHYRIKINKLTGEIISGVKIN